MDTRFHCVYLLTSLDPRCEGDYYIGYTVNPLRRLRQHNGELVNGARHTSRRGRPWRIVCCVSGFTEDRAALKFEWCWQNPTVSARLKHTVGVLKGLRRLPYAVGTLHLLIRAPLFNQLDLTLHIFEPELLQAAQAKAEIFLVMGGGGRQLHAAQSPPPDRAEALGTASTQVLNTSSAYGATATTQSPLLPPLEPSSLFHVEVTTHQRFEDVYLSHDRCLLLPSGGLTGGNGSFATEREGEESCLSASCPYDVSVLSQAARAEWSNASVDDGSSDAEVDKTVSDGDVDERTRRFGLVGDSTPSQSPPRGCSRMREGTPDNLLRSDSDEEGVEECDQAMIRSPPSPSPSAHRVSPPRTEVGRGCASSPRQRTPSAPPSPPPAPRIPLRFASYRDADFAREHGDAQYRLHHGLLPCSLCALPLRPPCVVHCSRAPFCDLRCHLGCLAMWMLYEEEVSGVAAAAAGAQDKREAPSTQQTAAEPPQRFRRLLPSQPCPCPLCGVALQWGVLIKELKRRAVVEARLQAAHRRTRIEQRWQARLAYISGRRSAKETRGLHMRRLRRSSRSSVGGRPCPPPSAAVAAAVAAAGSASSTTGSDPLRSSAVASPVAPVDASSVSSIGAAAPPIETSGLSWTAFSEDEWLL